jgi:four helix bundle protein
MPERISSFKDLRVYKLAFELQQDVFATSKDFPAEERYALTDQVRRTSRSIGLIFPKPGTSGAAHFLSKLTDADGEQALETTAGLD